MISNHGWITKDCINNNNFFNEKRSIIFYDAIQFSAIYSYMSMLLHEWVSANKLAFSHNLPFWHTVM